MRITRLEAWPVRLKLAEPYTTAYETVDTAENVFVRLHTNGAMVGHGCAAPDPAVTGETVAEVAAALEVAAGVVPGLDPTRPALAYERLHQALGRRPATLAALDMAVLDLMGQACGLPVWKLLGGAREAVRTSVTVGILDERETVEQARRWVRAGFTFLKLKVGKDAEADAVRVLKVREAVGPGVDLAVDANQGYTVEGCLLFLRMTAPARLVFLEQPTPRDTPEQLGEVQVQSFVPVMADEALASPEEAAALANRAQVQLFNIKLMKVGGAPPALAIDGIAGAAGIGVMVGCLDECALGIAAGLHFALGRPNVTFADLDGHLAIRDDPSAGSVRLRDGMLYPNDAPGLGAVLE